MHNYDKRHNLIYIIKEPFSDKSTITKLLTDSDFWSDLDGGKLRKPSVSREN